MSTGAASCPPVKQSRERRGLWDPSQFRSDVAAIGEAVLLYSNALTFFLCSMAVVLPCALARRIRTGRYPGLAILLRGVFAVLLICGGVTTSNIFILTRRAQCLGLSEESLALVGLVVLLCTTAIASHELRAIFFGGVLLLLA